MEIPKDTINAFKNLALRQRELATAVADEFLTPYFKAHKIQLKADRDIITLVSDIVSLPTSNQRVTIAVLLKRMTDADSDKAAACANAFVVYLDSLTRA